MRDRATAGGRWAIYFTPRRETALGRFGRAWYEGGARALDGSPLDSETYRRLTARPRRYGFHATLKAPFRLVDTETETALSNALFDVAARFHPIEMPPLGVALIGGFLAVVPTEPSAQVNALAAACAVDLDRLRAPQTDDEYQRRMPERLSDRQRACLRA